jgi:hypothetical protein
MARLTERNGTEIHNLIKFDYDSVTITVEMERASSHSEGRKVLWSFLNWKSLCLVNRQFMDVGGKRELLTNFEQFSLRFSRLQNRMSIDFDCCYVIYLYKQPEIDVAWNMERQASVTRKLLGEIWVSWANGFKNNFVPRESLEVIEFVEKADKEEH